MTKWCGSVGQSGAEIEKKKNVSSEDAYKKRSGGKKEGRRVGR